MIFYIYFSIRTGNQKQIYFWTYSWENGFNATRLFFADQGILYYHDTLQKITNLWGMDTLGTFSVIF